ncbi:hypothetical protein, partial [Kineosporia sp. R_H_3]|uniref:hypothetical protein n=1 Tax=Kineosporia sp. R_H_3 TaxID=1961848 RepID=UPI0018E9728A
MSVLGAIAAAVLTVTAPGAALIAAGEAATAGAGTMSVIGAAAAVLGGVVGTFLTARKTNGDLRSQVWKDASDWMTRQDTRIKEQDARLAQQDARIAEQDTKFAQVAAYLHQDRVWHYDVERILAENGITSPTAPAPPDFH